MIQIAADLAKLYTSFMEQKGLETDQHRYYIKWLRYYLDFCHKYKFKRQNKESLSAFLEKLKEKKQAESLRKQAHYAVSLFYEMGHLSGRKTRNGTSNGKSAVYGHERTVGRGIYGTFLSL